MCSRFSPNKLSPKHGPGSCRPHVSTTSTDHPHFTTITCAANEVLDDKLRQIVSMTQLGVYAVGYMYLPALAYVFPDWRWLTCSTAVVGFATLPAL